MPAQASTEEVRPRVGVLVADPITAAGVRTLVTEVGFDPVLDADPDAVDALLVLADDGRAEQMRALALEGMPVVWLHRDREHGGLRVEPDDSALPLERSDRGDVARALAFALIDRFAQSTIGAGAIDRGPKREVELSPIELEVLRLLAEGQDTAEIAASLFYSERTVKNAITRAVRALGAVNRSNAVATALRSGYL